MPRKNMKKGGEDMPEAFSPMAGVVAETPAPVMEGGKKKRVYKKKGGGEVEDALSSLALLGLQKGMVGAGEHEMEGGKKKKRVYKKKKGGEDMPEMEMPEMPVMEGGKKKRVYKKKGGAVSQVAGQLKNLSDAIAKIMKF